MDPHSYFKIGGDGGQSNRSGYQSSYHPETEGGNIPFRSQRSNLSGSQHPHTLEDADDLDADLKNKRMVQIYLKSPYKILSIKDIKQRDREGSPSKLFHAENQLKVATDFRKAGLRRKAKNH
mmetsp:Transcript_550/g.613  ORF Transcript_550/g.613 Transcript_550/m.613 type:complete len:122 (+) Transcript_550:472-837(+)